MHLPKPEIVGPPCTELLDYDFKYADSDTLEQEIYEFFNLSDHPWVYTLPRTSCDSYDHIIHENGNLNSPLQVRMILSLSLGLIF